ncbi:mechanosensitive ion channel domain-containing protein [Pontibacter sp. G13]|uniref:mechanosensitive ion channel domain-containing protein n=1 Tax=Pontibacter sp. G13 TaxID=3074898 RepID=UPI00288ACA09|nr:mechanosensitive ion channel domain-containing protein [Pontibacter sp. G13]WNJ18983.1 hypothetical protein RJD25_00710 [Pontibacter sp. G13]
MAISNMFPNLPTMLSLLVIGLLIFAGFWLIRRLLFPLFVRSAERLTRYQEVLPVVESVVWVVYALLVLDFLITPNPFVGSVLLAVVAASMWSYIQAFMYGLFIRTGLNFRIGQQVRFLGGRGQIIRMGLISLDLEIGNGEVQVIPYHQVHRQSMVKENPSEDVKSYMFELEWETRMPHNLALLHLKKKILALPWAVPSLPPKVERMAAPNKYQIVMYAPDKRYFPLMEEELRRDLTYEGKAKEA